MIGVFLADGFEESEGIITIDLLRRAGFDVNTSHVFAQRVLAAMALVVGGAGVGRAEPGVRPVLLFAQ